jgi:hypothetical protein
MQQALGRDPLRACHRNRYRLCRAAMMHPSQSSRVKHVRAKRACGTAARQISISFDSKCRVRRLICIQNIQKLLL